MVVDVKNVSLVNESLRNDKKKRHALELLLRLFGLHLLLFRHPRGAAPNAPVDVLDGRVVFLVQFVVQPIQRHFLGAAVAQHNLLCGFAALLGGTILGVKVVYQGDIMRLFSRQLRAVGADRRCSGGDADTVLLLAAAPPLVAEHHRAHGVRLGRAGALIVGWEHAFAHVFVATPKILVAVLFV